MMRCFAVLALLFAACTSTRAELDPIARARVASDYSTYALRRVGVLPFVGEAVEIEHGKALQRTFAAELVGHVPFEVVPLDQADLEEVEAHDPLRRGRTRPEAVLELARRYRLDGVLVGTVTELSTWPHARAGIEVDLVASETGMAIWTGRTQVDAAQQSTREHLQRWLDDTRSTQAELEGVDVWLMSPRRLVEFAAAQVAALL